MNKYIGLLKADGTEPRSESGYKRAPDAEVVFFPESIGAGYGNVCSVCYFDAEAGGAPLCTASLPEPVCVPSGTIPIFKDNKIMLGLSVKAAEISRPGSVMRSR